MIEIRLNHGQVALIDDHDVDVVARYRWYAWKDPKSRTFYALSVTRPPIRMHRFLMGAGPGEQIDHVNGNGLDNRRSNLRRATYTEQRRNQCKRRTAKASAFKGVVRLGAPGTPAGARWCAEIKVNGRRLRKYAQSEVEAALKYNEMAVEHFAAFARLNNVPTGRGDCR